MPMSWVGCVTMCEKQQRHIENLLTDVNYDIYLYCQSFSYSG